MDSIPMDEFEDIRPYRDHEVEVVVKTLHQQDELIIGMAKFRFPMLYNSIPFIAKSIVRAFVKKKSKSIKTILDIQHLVGDELNKILTKTTENITISGLDQLNKEESYLFIGNHRDISMDPALVSYLLYKSNHNTVEIAIGDNLLKKQYISDLMRLNKSFIVKRSVIGREKLFALKHLSRYIHHQIKAGHSIWIAQKEGRAKDGIDFTEPAIIKMLQLGGHKDGAKMKLSDAINSLNIIPISISYELDPCDSMKAKEVYMNQNNETYTKDENTDQKSIVTGLLNPKGNIHISFGEKVVATTDDAGEIAKEIDTQIIGNYLLQAPNYIAYQKLQTSTPSIGPKMDSLTVDVQQEDLDKFEARLALIDKKYQSTFLAMYANPVINKLKLNSKK
jgi:1-acyl-sn-glycerol-3-phosphate acyltransferase